MNELLVIIKLLGLILGLPLAWALSVRIYYTALEHEQRKVIIKLRDY